MKSAESSRESRWQKWSGPSAKLNGTRGSELGANGYRPWLRGQGHVMADVGQKIEARLRLEYALLDLTRLWSQDPEAAREWLRQNGVKDDVAAPRLPEPLVRSRDGQVSLWPDADGQLLCPHCRTEIGWARVVRKDIEIEDRDINGERSRAVQIGAVVQLTSQFVNASRRHESGRPWYVVGNRCHDRRARVRLPAIVTCRCGSAISLESPDGAARYAAANGSQRFDLLAKEVDAEVEDYYIQRQVDLARGK
jgi:hypothetical protein